MLTDERAGGLFAGCAGQQIGPEAIDSGCRRLLPEGERGGMFPETQFLAAPMDLCDERNQSLPLDGGHLTLAIPGPELRPVERIPFPARTGRRIVFRKEITVARDQLRGIVDDETFLRGLIA